jgi:hypothetical protein
MNKKTFMAVIMSLVILISLATQLHNAKSQVSLTVSPGFTIKVIKPIEDATYVDTMPVIVQVNGNFNLTGQSFLGGSCWYYLDDEGIDSGVYVPGSAIGYSVNVNISSLSVGQHKVTIFVKLSYYQRNSPPFGVYYTSALGPSEYFYVASPTPSPIPSPSPTLLRPTPSLPYPPSPSPSVAEFPNWIILQLTAAAATMVVWVRKRKER